MAEIKMFAVAVLNIYTICNNWKFLHIKSEDLCFAPAMFDSGKGGKKKKKSTYSLYLEHLHHEMWWKTKWTSVFEVKN